MKATFFAGGALAAAALFASAPTFAQSISPSYYVNLGYSNLGADSDGPNYNAVTGRLGARLNRYFGVEGEISGGLNNDQGAHMDTQYAGYGVGYLPVLPNADLFARIGYGATNFSTERAGPVYSSQDNSWNWGVGGQYFFNGPNGVRVDYTRSNYDNGPDANTWGVSYVRKF